MTIQEIRQKIAESEYAAWLNSVELEIEFIHIQFQLKLVGIGAVYEFVNRQVNGWSKKGENIPKELKESRDFFEMIQEELINLFKDLYERKSAWSNIVSSFNRKFRHYFIFESPAVDFLIRVFLDFPDSFPSAYNFITGDVNRAFDDKDNIIGTLLAYEFSLKDNSQISERKSSERVSLSRIRNEFHKHLSDAETNFNDFLRKTNEKYDEYSLIINQTKESKETLFNDWFKSANDAFILFDEQANQKMKDLERTYEEHLRLKKPADYWNKRAVVLKAEGFRFIYWLVGLVLFGCTTLYMLLWLTPEGMLLSFIKGQGNAIKWSIVYITFISLLVFGIKAIAKAMFSAFHLSRDAEEREQLTYVYLALIKEAAVDEKDKSLIMQSLFSRSDTGLLKEDSAPTMPGNFADKIIHR